MKREDPYEALRREVRKQRILLNPALGVYVLFATWIAALTIAFAGELLALWYGTWVTTPASRIALSTPLIAVWIFLMSITVSLMRVEAHERRKRG